MRCYSQLMSTSQVAPHPLHLQLPHLGTDAEFNSFRELLHAAEYNHKGICRRLKISSIIDFKAKCDGRTEGIAMEAPIDVLLRLFLDGEFVEGETIASLLPSGSLALLHALQLLSRDPTRPDELFANITLYPAEADLVLAGDRPGTPDGSPYKPPLDVVYPGVIENTRHFLATLPQTPCEALLDIGTGSGVAALSAARRYARQSWGTDIAARSVRFAEFNRRLNAIANASILNGDMYEPVRNLTFDRIVTHPPYVPAAKIGMIFADGGANGEEILQGIIEGLPRHLRLGGRFHTLVLGADCEDQTFEDRIRLWLGSKHTEFDLVMISHSLRPPTDFLARAIARGKLEIGNLRYWADSWTRRKVQFLFYGTILLRRHLRERAPITARVQSGPVFSPRHTEWLLEWATACEDPNFAASLMGTHPALAPDAEMRVLHRLQEGRFVAQVYAVESSSPFNSELRCPAWLVNVLSGCNGSRTWREHFERALREGLVEPETTAQEFAGVLAAVVGQGILRLPEHPLPPDAPGPDSFGNELPDVLASTNPQPD
jgi:SAM-dependent methyltransferase